VGHAEFKENAVINGRKLFNAMNNIEKDKKIESEELSLFMKDLP